MTEGPQRQRRRFQVSLPVRIWHRIKGTHDFDSTRGAPLVEQTFTKNISTRGCYFSLPHEVAVSSEIEMEIQMPAVKAFTGALKLRCHATVVRVESGSEGDIGIACQIHRYWFSQSMVHTKKIRVA